MTASDAKDAKALWTTFGLVLGMTIGTWFSAPTLGVSLGLFLFSAAGAIIDYLQGRAGIFPAVLAGAAFLWVVGVILVMRT